MGIGPKNTSLLTKLKLKSVTEMTDDELKQLVSNDRTYRSQQRAMGRANKIMSSSKKPKVERVVKLESIGLAPALIVKLRASGRPDSEIIADLKQKGVL